MKSVIAFADGRRVNLHGGVGPELFAELEAAIGRTPRGGMRCGGCGGAIHIRHGWGNRRQLYGIHYEKSGCRDLAVRRSAPMSDEHRRQAEYHALAAQRAGLSADLEVPTTRGTRVDLVVDGRIGFEIQRSELSAAAAADRTARSVASGLGMVAWCSDRSVSPSWISRVPGYRLSVTRRSEREFCSRSEWRASRWAMTSRRETT